MRFATHGVTSKSAREILRNIAPPTISSAAGRAFAKPRGSTHLHHVLREGHQPQHPGPLMREDLHDRQGSRGVYNAYFAGFDIVISAALVLGELIAPSVGSLAMGRSTAWRCAKGYA
jgi:hypothetical protein